MVDAISPERGSVDAILSSAAGRIPMDAHIAGQTASAIAAATIQSLEGKLANE
ncbi:hypothetical protein [Cupriavidus sp. YR651]|uniref:hypothetical protein n=1 Tax=Cupriavidus sp. YR651 TaxID=1855315 RepID=UPI0015A4DA50|nr:hypothetical protein [Cupriavidus sp. YR651]